MQHDSPVQAYHLATCGNGEGFHRRSPVTAHPGGRAEPDEWAFAQSDEASGPATVLGKCAELSLRITPEYLPSSFPFVAATVAKRVKVTVTIHQQRGLCTLS